MKYIVSASLLTANYRVENPKGNKDPNAKDFFWCLKQASSELGEPEVVYLLFGQVHDAKGRRKAKKKIQVIQAIAHIPFYTYRYAINDSKKPSACCSTASKAPSIKKQRKQPSRCCHDCGFLPLLGLKSIILEVPALMQLML